MGRGPVFGVPTEPVLLILVEPVLQCEHNCCEQNAERKEEITKCQSEISYAHDPKLNAQNTKLVPLVAQRLVAKGLAPGAVSHIQ